jgi:hypothetical protein
MPSRRASAGIGIVAVNWSDMAVSGDGQRDLMQATYACCA